MDLSPIDDPALVAPACAAAIGVTLAPGDDAGRGVADTLTTQQGLLVLDTCEHVLVAAGQLATTVLRTAPNVRILATSRRALGLTGELAWPVPPLALPPVEAASATEITSHAAVQLFVARRSPSTRTFTSTTALLRTSPRSARRSTGCRSPSSWRPPAPISSARRPSGNG